MPLRKRFWFETVGSVVSVAFLVLMLAWKDWVEIVFRVDPDHHSGSLEVGITAACALVVLASLTLASIEWRRSARPAT